MPRRGGEGKSLVCRRRRLARVRLAAGPPGLAGLRARLGGCDRWTERHRARPPPGAQVSPAV